MLKGYLRLIVFVILNPRKFITALLVVFLKDSKEFKRRIKLNYNRSNYRGMMEERYSKWFRKNYPKRKDLIFQKKQSKNFKYQPKISIIVPTFNTPINFLHACFQSVINQTYQNWELCVVDDGSRDKKLKYIIKQYCENDKRIKCVFNKKNGGISVVSNIAIKLSTGEFIGFLDHDDILWPNALFEIVNVLNINSKLDFLYSDEDKLSQDGKIHFNPSFKPDWNPDYLRTANYIVHFVLVRRALLNKLGGFRSVYNGAQDWDLFLRITRETKKIFHIPKVLYSWRVSKTSTATEGSSSKIKSYAYLNQEKVLRDDLKARSYQGKILPTKLLGIWRIKYKIKNQPLVSIIIPTHNHFEHINACLFSIINKTSYKNYEIIIVDTDSKDEKVVDLYDEIKLKYKRTKILYWKKKFNFSVVCNFGASESSGKYLLFLNNDTEIITPDWIESMLEHAMRKEVGAVGCKLLFSNNTIQHAGVVLGLKNYEGEDVVAGHAFRGLVDHHPDTHLIDSIRNYSAVTAACLMISKDKFNQIKGFDQKFRVAFNDVDFCLKLTKKGYVNVYTPFSVLYHVESASVGQLGNKKRDMNEYKKEIQLMFQKWGEIIKNDPNYNINLTKRGEDFAINTSKNI